MKKILIIGPIGDFGGRELEIGFIANSFSKTFKVSVCSTGSFTSKSQIFDFNSNFNSLSIPSLLCSSSFLIKITSFISWLRNKRKLPIFFYANNQFNKKFLNLDNQYENQIKNQIDKHDLIFICATISSKYVDFIINHAAKLNKPIFFRTTGKVEKLEKSALIYLKKVKLFMHHSEGNASNLNKQINLPYVIIDQCAYEEKALLEIKLLKRHIATYITISRLVKEKNIDVVIKAFLAVKQKGDKLFVVGDGPELQNLKNSASGDISIIFTGFVSNKDLKYFLNISDCVIISHCDGESGPLTGIEAMTASRIIISAKTGAMQERIPFNKYWFNNLSTDLSLQIKLVKELNALQILEISKKNRDKYLQDYSIEKIQHLYLSNIEDQLK
jgi:glycosyltransferase involved in cell wall biosynthesis